MTDVRLKFAPPPYLQPGSEGPAVNVLLKFLVGWAAENGQTSTGIELDGEYGTVGIGWMGIYQASHDIDPDGACGPESRRTMQECDGFDFEQTLMDRGEELGITKFVQLDGTDLYWGPGIEPQEDEQAARSFFYKAWHGN